MIFFNMPSVLEDDCIIISRNDNEFWAISKGLANLNIYKWDNHINKFVIYEHNIENTDKLSCRLSACFDKEKGNILYIINCFEIIIIDIENNTNQQIEVELDYKVAVSATFQDKLHIIIVNNDQHSFLHYILSSNNELVFNSEFYQHRPFIVTSDQAIKLYETGCKHYLRHNWNRWGQSWTTHKYPFISIFDENHNYFFHLSQNKITIRDGNKKWFIDDTECPIKPNSYLLCKQSLNRNILLLNGFFRDEDIIIPM